MKKITLILLLLIPTLLLSQTKKETEDWINNNINNYPVNYGDNPIEVVENIIIDGSSLYFYHHWNRQDDNYYSGTWTKINLKDIKSIEYSFDKSPGLNNKWIELHLNFNKGKSYQGKSQYPNEFRDNISYQILFDRTAIIMRLNMDFVESGMKKRIEKALLHIIKSYGGNAIVKTVKKEPF